MSFQNDSSSRYRDFDAHDLEYFAREQATDAGDFLDKYSRADVEYFDSRLRKAKKLAKSLAEAADFLPQESIPKTAERLSQMRISLLLGVLLGSLTAIISVFLGNLLGLGFFQGLIVSAASSLFGIGLGELIPRLMDHRSQVKFSNMSQYYDNIMKKIDALDENAPSHVKEQLYEELLFIVRGATRDKSFRQPPPNDNLPMVKNNPPSDTDKHKSAEVEDSSTRLMGEVLEG